MEIHKSQSGILPETTIFALFVSSEQGINEERTGFCENLGLGLGCDIEPAKEGDLWPVTLPLKMQLLFL